MDQNIKLQVGDLAPEFELPIVGGGMWKLSDALDRASTGVIVYFYPRAMTPGCTKEACDFRDVNKDLLREGYEIIGISPDSLSRVEEFTNKESLNFPLASDENREVMRAYGAFGEKKNYGKIVHGVIRSTFVVSKDRLIVRAHYAVKATGHVGRLLKELGV